VPLLLSFKKKQGVDFWMDRKCC